MFRLIRNQISVLDNERNTLRHFDKIMTMLLLRMTAFIISPLLFVGSLFYFMDGYNAFAYIEILAGVLLLFLAFTNYIHPHKKKLIILSIFYLVSVFVLITTGVAGGGFTSVLVSIIFISMLSGNQFRYMQFFLVNVIILFTITVLMYSGLFDQLMIHTYKDTWPFLIVLILAYIFAIVFTVSLYKKTIITQYSINDEQRRYLDNLINSVSDAIVAMDTQGNITTTNTAFQRLFDLPQTGVQMNYFDLIRTVQARTIQNIRIDCSILDSDVTDGSYYIQKNNQVIYLQRHVDLLRDEQEQKLGYIILLRDITEQRQTEEELLYLSYHDRLTSLYNRQFFEVEIERLKTKRFLPISLLLIDVNGLKLINDSFGHKMGDSVLIETANCIKQSCRSSDIISRIGGDEFVVILPKTNQDKALEIKQRILHSSKEKTVQSLELSFSIGIGILLDEHENIQTIYKNMEDDLLRYKLSETHSMRSKTIDLIMQTLFEKNNREMLHSKRVGRYSELLAFELGLAIEEVNEIKLAGFMHDIGKIGIEEAILNKTSNLSQEEWEKCKQHSEIGFRILSSLSDFTTISHMVYEHHENYNGSGYPKGIKGQSTSVGARILRITDSFDAMTGPRTYRPSLSVEESVIELLKGKDTLYDPLLVDVFVQKVIPHITNEKID